jgi:hypothetical protein
MRFLRESLVVPASPSVVSQHFWDVNLLRKFWLSITSVEMKYDDGVNQECLMSVYRDAKEEHIRIIRFRNQDEITFFNPEPPPMMSFHRGAWRFQPLPDGSCEVVAEREYELIVRAEESVEAFSCRAIRFQARFEERIRDLLSAFHQYITDSHEVTSTSAASTS